MSDDKNSKEYKFQDLLKQGMFEDEIADLVLEKVLSDSDFEPVLEKYKKGEIDDFDFIDIVWQKFSDKLEN